MTVYAGNLRDRQLEWARDDAEKCRQKLMDTRRELFRLRDVQRLAARVVAGLDEDGFRIEAPGGYDGFTALVDELRAALGKVEA